MIYRFWWGHFEGFCLKLLYGLKNIEKKKQNSGRTKGGDAIEFNVYWKSDLEG